MTVLPPEPTTDQFDIRLPLRVVAVATATCCPRPTGDGRDVDLFAYSSLGSQTGSLPAGETPSETDSDADSEQLASTLTSPPPRRPRSPSPAATAGVVRGSVSPACRRSPPRCEPIFADRPLPPTARALWPAAAPPSGPGAGRPAGDERVACPARPRPAGGPGGASLVGELAVASDARRPAAGPAGPAACSGSLSGQSSSARRPPQARKRAAELRVRPRRAALRWRPDLEVVWTADVSPARLELSALFDV